MLKSRFLFLLLFSLSTIERSGAQRLVLAATGGLAYRLYVPPDITQHVVRLFRRFSGVRQQQGTVQLDADAADPGANHFGGFLYRATVVNDKDPLQRHRVQVSIAGTLAPSAWATACIPPGTTSAPALGDNVWVTFEAGDTSMPVWLGVIPS